MTHGSVEEINLMEENSLIFYLLKVYYYYFYFQVLFSPYISWQLFLSVCVVLLDIIVLKKDHNTTHTHTNSFDIFQNQQKTIL